MTLNGSKYKFDPSELTIKAGDVITFHNKTRWTTQRLILGRQHSEGRR